MAIDHPDFTVITPVFNGAKYLEETVNSVMKYAPVGNYEYIVVNDGSTDATSSILNKFEKSVLIINQSNSGEAAAVNRALQSARGRYSIVVSADDPLCCSKLFDEAQDILNTKQEVVAVYPDWQMINSEGHVIREIRTLEYSLDSLLGLNICIPGPGAIFRTEAALQIGGRNILLRFGSDYDFWLRLAMFGDFKRIPKILAQWRFHEESTSIKMRGLEMATERIQIIETFLEANDFPILLKQKARGNVYYRAALLGYFDDKIPYRTLLVKSLIFRRGWVEAAKFYQIMYLLGSPFTKVLWDLAKVLCKRLGLSYR